ncbi:PadR family transcriptional regulator [Granulicoccus sp. GXG6511]|uniref:PadR family transcriptional regulator n=1 Tax=Granulicoccus sp. GXG6511 TaxID=3381351 RepID=UPI003D7DAB05
MSLKFALLALLTGSPMTGYEIGKSFDASVGHVWNAPGSQIYPELRRLANAGLLNVEEVPEGRRKKIYSVTAAGRESLREWMNSPSTPEPTRENHFLKAAYLDWADPEAAQAQLQLWLAAFTQRLHIVEAVRDSLLNGTHPILRERLRTLPTDQHEAATAFKVFAFEGMAEEARQKIAWAERGLELLARLERTPARPADAPATQTARVTT